eukprot:9883609-Karenia_brevis.AAC.1
MRAIIELPLVGKSAAFDFTHGGKQGGIETPDEWRMMVDFILEPVVMAWDDKQFGFQLFDDEGCPELLLSHVVYADNIILFSRDFNMMQAMVSDVYAAFGQFKDCMGR